MLNEKKFIKRLPDTLKGDRHVLNNKVNLMPMFFLKNGPTPASFLFNFVFSNTLQILQQIFV